MTKSPGISIVASLVVLGLAAAQRCRHEHLRARTTSPLLTQLAELRLVRVFAPRLSLPVKYAGCRVELDDGPSHTSLRCAGRGEPPSPAFLDLAARAATAVHLHADPPDLRAAALTDLLSGNDRQKVLDRSISYLAAAAQANADANAWTDLAAAYLLRSALPDHAQDLMSAVEFASRAIEAVPTSAAAHFDMALALDGLGLHDRAVLEWARSADLEPRTPWADEARERSSRTLSLPAPAQPADTSVVGLTAFARVAPAAAASLAWDSLLPRWGAEALGHEPAAAKLTLERVDAIASALAKEHGDSSLADATAAIRSSWRDDGALALARGHTAYGRARAAYNRGDYRGAEQAFRITVRFAPPSSALRHLAMLGRGSALNYMGRYAAAESIAGAVAVSEDAARHPTVAGRANWTAGTLELRRGLYEQALRRAQKAESCFARAGDQISSAGVAGLSSDAYFALAQSDRAFAELKHGLYRLRTHPHSVQRHNVLFSAVKYSAAAGAYRAARAFADADVAASASSGSQPALVEALLSRARVAVAANWTRSAQADVDSSEAIIETWPAGEARSWFTTQRRLVDGEAKSETRPGETATDMDSVVEFFAARHNRLRLIPALLTRSQAEQALGRTRAADSDLERLMTLLDDEHANIHRLDFRAALLDHARDVFDRIVLERLAVRDTLGALEALERGRAALDARHYGDGQARPFVAPGHVGVEYALIGNNLMVWTISGGNLRLVRVAVDSARLLGRIHRVQDLLEIHADLRSEQPALSDLYDELLRPIALDLPKGAPIEVVADGELSGAPFAALLDRKTGRYLVEDHSIAFTSRLSARGIERRWPERPTVMIIDDPEAGSLSDENVVALPGANIEAASVGNLYAHRLVLAGAAARSSAIVRASMRADVVHFAGHAVFDDAHPEDSYLIVAPDDLTNNNRGFARLTAERIAALDLRRVRLVVLSGCRTLGTRPGHSGAFAGLAGAVLSAGAGGVVGSLWEVNDALTSPLMIAFHRAFARSGDGADALRRAQLELLRSSDQDLRSPATWAGFRYFGS